MTTDISCLQAQPTDQTERALQDGLCNCRGRHESPTQAAGPGKQHSERLFTLRLLACLLAQSSLLLLACSVFTAFACLLSLHCVCLLRLHTAFAGSVPNVPRVLTCSLVPLPIRATIPFGIRHTAWYSFWLGCMQASKGTDSEKLHELIVQAELAQRLADERGVEVLPCSDVGWRSLHRLTRVLVESRGQRPAGGVQKGVTHAVVAAKGNCSWGQRRRGS